MLYIGHKDSVTSASFSYDGKYVCTGDLSGVVQVWLTSDGKCVWNFETSTIEVSIHLPICLSNYLSIHPSYIHPSIYPSIYLSIYLSNVFIYPVVVMA